MGEEFEAENEGGAIPTQLQWMANPRTISEMRQNGGITASSVVFVVKGSKVAQKLKNKGINLAGVWHRVEAFTNAGPDSWCELCCGWGHIDNMCGNTPKGGYCSGNHQTSDHKCNVVGCTAKQGSLCSHTPEKSPSAKGNHIVFSSRCAKKSEAASAARQSRMMGTLERAPTSQATQTATGTNSMLDGHRPRGGEAADGGRAEGEMADAVEDEATGEARDVMITKAVIMTRTATETETKGGALATND